MKILNCECGECEDMLKILSYDDDMEIFFESDLKENQIELQILSEKKTMSIIVDRKELLKALKKQKV